ncbi:MAG: pyrroline-5-carboxylate reductase [Janthinobacterium lividum]
MMAAERGDNVLLVGAGRMGGAMLRGWLDQGISGSRISVVDPHPSDDMPSFCRSHGVSLNPSGHTPVDVLILAVKPQMLDAGAPGIEPWVGPGTAVVSILAGRTLADLANRFPRAAGCVRAMPNLPAAVGRGVTGLATDGRLDSQALDRIERWLGAIGLVERLPHEDQIDMVTAVSGSGPAYVFLLAEALAQAGERLGLAPDLAARLARATVEGAGELLYRSPDISPATLRQNVTSPGGTTAAALAVLMADNALGPLLDKAVDAAFQRARDLSH